MMIRKLHSTPTIFTLALLGVSALMLSACGTFGATRDVQKPQLVAEPDGPTLMLAEAADRATRALETLAAVEQHRTPSPSAAAMIPNAPAELQRAVSFQWAGPVEPLARDLAGRAGYSFRAIGNTPVTPVLVNIHAYNRPLIEVFRDIGLQMGTRADLRLDGNTRSVEVIYSETVNAETQNSSTPRRRR